MYNRKKKIASPFHSLVGRPSITRYLSIVLNGEMLKKGLVRLTNSGDANKLGMQTAAA